MSTLGERKCALLLVTLRKGDRRHLLARLPAASARSVRRLVAELEALPLPVSDLAQILLADEVRGLTTQTSIDLNQLMALSGQLPPLWFARVLSVWGGVNHAFCLSLLESSYADKVKDELQGFSPMPPKLLEAVKAEVMHVVQPDREAA
ncbi:hypothetical protein [Marilutibacter alkalisoli]|uniref:Uncharacterized protein n=1 Tax=Marilutibacter alkalisoli TaxID=2591633 RepID=A0A514BRY0_9GAMM|nr:hypothetical protein [Lysobacter alkalisoli]QDH70146.1 hypothetical protein FKV23_08595 [Lysobacter alkalisoli]